MLPRFVLLFASCLAASAACPVWAVTIDGSLADPEYGFYRAIQVNNTSFGDNHLDNQRYSEGSELDFAHAAVLSGTLYLMFTGNFQSNFTHLEIFIDCIPGGQGTLRSDNANVDGGGLNRMAGLSFDAQFKADYYLTFACGDVDSVFGLYGYFADLPAAGGGTPTFLGSTDATVAGSGNPVGIQFTINNSNVLGVHTGCDANFINNADGAGIELGIPLVSIGNPSGCIDVCAFLNRPAHDFISNQFLSPLPPGSCELGEPSAVDLASMDGDQFFSICGGSTPAARSTWGRVKVLYR